MLNRRPLRGESLPGSAAEGCRTLYEAIIGHSAGFLLSQLHHDHHEIRYNPGMKPLAFSPIALAVLVALTALPSSAKTKVELKDAQGKDVGSVTLWQQGSGVGLQLHLHGLPPGEHAIHFHQSPKCDAPDFKTAGGHFNPESKKHGFENPEGHHAGDMKNFTVDAHGKADLKLEDNDVTLGDGAHSLFSNGGTAIVIHAKADDYKTDPSGNSGDRIACGEVTQ
jgi:Cu-Zn family superoxide dismutase